MMKKTLTICFMTALCGAPPASAMMAAGSPERAGVVPSTAPAPQEGKVDSVSLAAGRLVIGGVTYAYHPLNTVFLINGRRGTISDIRPGDRAQFQYTKEGAGRLPLLTSVSVQR